MKVLVNIAGWELSNEVDATTPESPETAGERSNSTKLSSGVFAKANRAEVEADGANAEIDAPVSGFSPTEPAPPSDDPEDNDVTLPPPPSLPRIES